MLTDRQTKYKFIDRYAADRQGNNHAHFNPPAPHPRAGSEEEICVSITELWEANMV